MRAMGLLEGIRRPWESSTEYKLRTGRGQVGYIVVPSQDGVMDEWRSWGPGVEVYREDDRGFLLFREPYGERIVEIPAGCHSREGQIDWERVGLARDVDNPYKFLVLVAREESYAKP